MSITGRPTILTDDLRLAAAEQVVSKLRKSGMSDEELAGAAQEIAQTGQLWMDGYELATRLDRNYGWDCNIEIANALDTFQFCARDELRKAEKVWAEDNDIQPPFENDTPVKLKSGETGVITGVSNFDAASYLIAIDGDERAHGPSQARRIVAFEDVTPTTAQGGLKCQT